MNLSMVSTGWSLAPRTLAVLVYGVVGVAGPCGLTGCALSRAGQGADAPDASSSADPAPYLLEPRPVFSLDENGTAGARPTPPPTAPEVAVAPSPETSRETGLTALPVNADPSLASAREALATAPAASDTPSTAGSASTLPADALEEDLARLAELRDTVRKGERLDHFDRLQLAKVEKRLIGHYLLGDHTDLERFESLIESLSRIDSTILSRELLKAAFFQELGMTDLRDEALRALPAVRTSSATTGKFAIRDLSFARRYEGYGAYERQDPDALSPGMTTIIYGEFVGFDNVEVERGGARGYRRSFSAFLSLFDADGVLVQRAPLLVAGSGNASEVVDDRRKPVNFWKYYRIPEDLGPGRYRVEVLAVDVESGATATARLEFRLGS